MKKIIYMVKKDVSLPNQSDNWFLFSGKEFKEYIESHDMTGRYFANLGGEENAPEIFIAECNKEQCRKWTAEYERHKYLRKVEKESNVVVFLESQLSNDGAELSLDDITASDDPLIEDDFIKNYEYQEVRGFLSKLPDRQRQVLELIYFASDVLSSLDIKKIFLNRKIKAESEAKLRGINAISPNNNDVLTEYEVADILLISHQVVHKLKCKGLKNLKNFCEGGAFGRKNSP